MVRKVLPKRGPKRDATPKVVYLIGILAYAAWAGWAYVLVTLSPDGLGNRVLFLLSAFLALFLTFLFIFYQTGRFTTGKAPSVVFYPAARRAFLVGIFVFIVGVMKLLKIFNILNAGLLGLVMLLLEIQISKR